LQKYHQSLELIRCVKLIRCVELNAEKYKNWGHQMMTSVPRNLHLLGIDAYSYKKHMV